ncbi:MAG: UPF0182 family protein, partial [Blastocatellia bacterium]
IAGRIALPAALAAGVFAGMIAWNAWEVWLLWRQQTPFGQTDPLYGRDIGFYFFTLPLLERLSALLFVTILAGLAVSVAVYLARGVQNLMSMRRAAAGGSDARGPRAHLLCLAALFFLALALRAWLNMPALLYSDSGPVAGASYTDINAVLPILRAQAWIAALTALVAIVSIFLSHNRLVLAGAVLFLLTIAAGVVYPGILQRFSVGPNELVKESPYITHNITATRMAWGLDRVEERELPGDKALTAADIRDNQPTIRNIRLWDQKPLLDTFSQLQEIRTYYDFHSVDNDRYRINGELQQVMLSAREMSTDSLPNRNWINERLSFTHGFGLTLGPVNQVTPEGLPVLFVQNIPPVATTPALAVERPEIYFGELSSEHVYVKTTAKEFNYPAGEDNVFASFAGTGGVSVASTWRQMLFASRFGDMKLLLSNDMTPESRVLYIRNIRERLTRVAPFLTFDSDPYLVISGGRLFWIADAYTVSDRYPYAEQLGGINYIRNSVKAVVDAYQGDVRLYVASENDPLIRTWGRVFPGILKPLGEMPADLRAHLRYPEDIFRLQAEVYSTWHMSQPQAFYNKEDQWAVVSMPDKRRERGGETAAREMDPYYTVMKLPGERSEEFILMLPFTPRNKENLASWMVARADGDNYGKLVVYRFPKQKLIYGPKQILGRINQDPEISRQISLWDQRGSEVIWGTLLVIPVHESLIYVQPLYLRAETSKIPELKRVIVAADNRIAMEATLEESLARVFGNAAPAAAPAPGATPAVTPPAGAQDLATRARGHYERAVQAQREGDWARYGEEIKQLGVALEQMAKPK